MPTEDYPGQAYFHRFNRNIRTAEEIWKYGTKAMINRILKSGTWSRCIFCRQFLPKQEWVNGPKWAGSRKHEAIQKSGYCTYCEEFNK